MKYTNEQYERGKKFREFYYQEINVKDDFGEGWWERSGENNQNRWVGLYLTGQEFSPPEKVAGDRARKLTDEFFAAKEKKMKYTEDEYARGGKYYEFYFGRPIEDGESLDAYVRCYMNAPKTGVPQEKEAFRKTEEFFAEKENKLKPSSYTFVSTDKDVDLLRIIREAPDAQFILIEKKNRNTNHVSNFLLINESILNNPAVKNLQIYEVLLHKYWGVTYLGSFDKSLSGTGYQGHETFEYPVHNLRAEIEAVIKALNPKDTKTTVTVW